MHEGVSYVPFPSVRDLILSLAELGELLRQLRVKSRLTQDSLADRMGLVGQRRRKTVERLERGHNRNPKLDLAMRYLRACGAPWGRNRRPF